MCLRLPKLYLFWGHNVSICVMRHIRRLVTVALWKQLQFASQSMDAARHQRDYIIKQRLVSSQIYQVD